MGTEGRLTRAQREAVARMETFGGRLNRGAIHPRTASSLLAQQMIERMADVGRPAPDYTCDGYALTPAGRAALEADRAE